MKSTIASHTPLKPTNRTGNSSSELQDEIRRRAYELYEHRGQGDGHDFEDWLQVEGELIPMKAKKVAAQGGTLQKPR